MTDTSKPTVDVLEATQKFGEQLVSTVKQSQSLALDAARTFAGALPSLPSTMRGRPTLQSLALDAASLSR